MADLTHTLDPADLKRQAIRKLGEIADKLGEKEKGADIQAAMELRLMMRRLKGQPGALDQRFNRALANADFSKAGDILKDLQDKLDSGELTEEERKALAKQLEELAKQLDKVAAGKKALENALKQAGCGKAMAGLSGKALRDALKALDEAQTPSDDPAWLDCYLNACRLRDTMAQIETINFEALRLAIQDLSNEFPAQYVNGPDHLKRLGEYERRLYEIQEALAAGDAATPDAVPAPTSCLIP